MTANEFMRLYQPMGTEHRYISSMTLDELEHLIDDPARDLSCDGDIHIVLSFSHMHGFQLLARYNQETYMVTDSANERVKYRTIEQAINFLQDLPGLNGDIRLDISNA